jgi:spoIIIJ-associated protein
MSDPTAAGGGERRVLEVRARTVDEAVARGLVRLGGLSRNEVNIEVLSEGRSGLLGFGSEEAVVRLTVLRPGEKADEAPTTAAPASAPPARPAERAAPVSSAPPAAPVVAESAPPASAEAPPAVQLPAVPPPVPPVTPVAASAPRGTAPTTPAGPVDLAQAEAVAIETTAALLGLMGFEDVTVEPADGLIPTDVEDSESLVLCIRGKGTQRLLHDDAEPLNALQFLVRLVVSRRVEGWVSVLLDVDGDRARRVQELLQLADQSAELVARGGRPVALPPMSAYERRVVHLALKDHPVVATQSIGSGDYRKVTVRLREQLLPEL